MSISRRTFLRVVGGVGLSSTIPLSCVYYGTDMAALADSGILVEAASFTELGGWKLDTQHYQQMGGCYLLAHGMGKPVANSATSVTIPYGPKTQPRGRSFLERDLQDSPKQWITPVPRHFETVESPS